MRKIIAGLDIGDAWIKLVVGEIIKDKLHVLACSSIPARGIKKGYVVNSESAIEAFSEVFNEVNETIGIKTDKVVVSIPSYKVESFVTSGSVSIENDNKTVGHYDIYSALQASVYKKYSESYELVDVIPVKYKLDDTNIVENPIGMKADKISVKSVAIVVPKNNIASIAKCLDKMDIKIVDICVGPLADYYTFEQKEYRDEVGAIVDIGDAKTEVAIFNKGVLSKCEVIDIGGEKIDADLSYVYKISRNDAIYLKETLCLADKNMASVKESLVFETKNKDVVKINQYDASEIAEARLTEILNLIKKQINLLTKKKISYIIITGGVTETLEFKSLVNQIFKNATVGDVNIVGARNNKYSTVLGLIKYYDNKLKLKNKDFSIYTVEEQAELGGTQKHINISENSILGKLFGYFFDN